MLLTCSGPLKTLALGISPLFSPFGGVNEPSV